MTSAAKARANRRNALKSTGPKTIAGKATVARNAHRHGLSLPVLIDPALSREADDLARRIEKSVTGAEADAYGHELAGRIAEAILDLRRVREAKQPLVSALYADPTAAGLAPRARATRSLRAPRLVTAPYGDPRVRRRASGRGSGWQNKANAKTSMLSSPLPAPVAPPAGLRPARSSYWISPDFSQPKRAMTHGEVEQ
jgi:hypothetical protein